MHSIYNFVTGPLAWIAFGIFIIGSILRLISMVRLAKKKDGPYLTYMSWKYSFRSIINWLIPFNSIGWQKSPITTIVTFIFHICLFLVPIFLSAHVILWDYFWGVDYWSLPNEVADYMTIAVIAACIYFAVRRIVQKEVKYVSQPMDWLVLIIAFLPFATGFLAYHQIFDYQVIIIAHIITGEIMLASIPFTRLSHMLFAPLMRAYIGSEFGGVRKVKDW